MDIQSIIERVKKLRSLATSNNLHEATNALAAAEKLIAEHRLSEAELSVEKKISEPIIEGQEFLYQTGKIVQWKSLLAILLAQHYGVYVYNDTDYSTGRKQTRYAMVGTESNIQILQYNFEYLVSEIARLCDLSCKVDRRGVSVERNSFCEGAVSGFIGKLREEKAQVEKSASSAAMVLLSNQYDLAKEETFKRHKLKEERAKSYGKFDHGAYHRGVAAGKSISVHGGLGGASGTKLLK